MSSVAEYLQEYGHTPSKRKLSFLSHVLPDKSVEIQIFASEDPVLDLASPNLNEKNEFKFLGTTDLPILKMAAMQADMLQELIAGWETRKPDWRFLLSAVKKLMETGHRARAVYLACCALAASIAATLPSAFSFDELTGEFLGKLSKGLTEVDKASLLYQFTRGTLSESTEKRIEEFLSSS